MTKPLFCHLLDKIPAWGYPRITSVILGITYRCNAHCTHCSQADFLNEGREKEELNREELNSLFHEFSKMKVQWVNLFGGEPLLRSDLLEIIQLGKVHGVSMIFETNAFLLDAGKISELKKNGLKAVVIGLDYADAVQQDEFKGLKGSWDRAVRAVRECKRQGLICSLSVTATRNKIKKDQLRPVLRLAKDLKADNVRIMLPVKVGRWREQAKEALCEPEYEELWKMVCEFRNYAFLNCHDSLNRINCRPLVRDSIFINAFGDVSPCCLVPLAFGNVREEKLTVILKRMWKHQLFKAPRKTCWPLDDFYYSSYILQDYGMRLS